MLRLASSVHQALSLKPATTDDFREQLTSCLILCAPTGMTKDDRQEWLRTAWATLSDLPSDLLREGCAEARKHADHPAKIVPIIMRTVGDAMRMRRQMETSDHVPRERHIEPQYVTPEAARAILEKHGLPIPEALKPRNTPP